MANEVRRFFHAYVMAIVVIFLVGLPRYVTRTFDLEVKIPGGIPIGRFVIITGVVDMHWATLEQFDTPEHCIKALDQRYLSEQIHWEYACHTRYHWNNFRQPG